MLPITLQNTHIYKISELVNKIGLSLNQYFSIIWVSGEISNLSFPKSGHIYFSLKDHKNQIRCVLFNHYFQKFKQNLKEGMHILVKANVSIYEARGDLQLIIQEVQLIGEGLLRQTFEQLKQKLHQAGWFDSRHKKILPKFPSVIGVITSATGAAFQDVLSVLKRRFPGISIILYPVLVQGELAAQQIVSAIECANKRLDANVLLLCRGGGSIEDLWPFNEEKVASAIFYSQLPIVTGIGHEIDFTISDFVADVRGPTPSAAAELIVPDSLTIKKEINQLAMRLALEMEKKLRQQKQNLMHLNKRIQHPKSKLSDQNQAVLNLKKQLLQVIQYKLTFNQQKLENLIHRLSNVSPLNTLKRGYAIVLKEKNLITDPALTKSGDQLKIKLAHGELNCIVI